MGPQRSAWALQPPIAILVHPSRLIKMTNVSSTASRPSRLSEKLRRAIEVKITTGATINDACARAGISPQGYHKALRRPSVRDYYEEVQRRFVAESDQMRAHAKAVAITVALDLMKNAMSEAIRARMAEFLAGDGKAPAVAVNIDARQATPRTVYTFVRPALLDAVPRATVAPSEGK